VAVLASQAFKKESKEKDSTPHCEDKSLQDEENTLLVFTVAGICN
jgi:hypothetical protein